MKKYIAIAVMGMAMLSASAEKADAGKTAVIDYTNLQVDEVNQTTVLTGNVIVTKGTLVLRAEKAVIKRTPDEYILVTLTTSAGKRASFRQKRDGGPALWVEGEASRIEFNERAAIVQLFGGARIRQLEGARLTDEIQSEYISYDSLREVFTARNDASGENKPGAGRGRMIIAPRKPRAGETDSAPASSPASSPSPASAPAPAAGL